MIMLDDILSRARLYGVNVCPKSDYSDSPFIIIDGWDTISEFNKAAAEIKEENPNDIFEWEEYDDSISLEEMKELEPRDTNLLDHYDWGFSDQYIRCDCCGKAVNTYNYNRVPGQAFYKASEYYCEECICSQHKDDYIDLCINNADMANAILDPKELELRGFKVLDKEHCHGLFTCNDNISPKDLLAKYEDNYDVIFNITSMSPYETCWEIWGKEKQVNNNQA